MTRTIYLISAVMVGCDGIADGTEIGDEGHAQCIGDETALSDLDLVLGDFSESAGTRITACEGSFEQAEATLQISALGDDAEYSDMEPAPWQDDTPPPATWFDVECVDSIWLPAHWTLEVPGVSVDWTGDLTLTADGVSRGSVSALFADNPPPPDPDDDEGGPFTQGEAPSAGLVVDSSVEPTTFVVDDMRRVELSVSGTLTQGSWDLEVAWMAETHPEGPDGTVSSLHEVVWAGRVEALTE